MAIVWFWVCFGCGKTSSKRMDSCTKCKSTNIGKGQK